MQKRLELGDPLALAIRGDERFETTEDGERYVLNRFTIRRENSGAFYMDTEWIPAAEAASRTWACCRTTPS